ncbi:MAG: cytochrome P450 [Cognatishimia sp.]|nr:cytochrome P450 [Cognatishimia sp.]
MHWNSTLNSWLLTRHANVLPTLSDHRLVADRMPVFMRQLPVPMREKFASLLKHFSLFFANMDPPAHTRM